jgi:hypothetical protein
VCDTIPVKVTNKLTDYGYSLVPLTIEITNWGKKHRDFIMKKKCLEHNNLREEISIQSEFLRPLATGWFINQTHDCID